MKTNMRLFICDQ